MRAGARKSGRASTGLVLRACVNASRRPSNANELRQRGIVTVQPVTEIETTLSSHIESFSPSHSGALKPDLLAQQSFTDRSLEMVKRTSDELWGDTLAWKKVCKHWKASDMQAQLGTRIWPVTCGQWKFLLVLCASAAAPFFFFCRKSGSEGEIFGRLKRNTRRRPKKASRDSIASSPYSSHHTRHWRSVYLLL